MAGDAPAEAAIHISGTTEGAARLELKAVAAVALGKSVGFHNFTICDFFAKSIRKIFLLYRSASDICTNSCRVSRRLT